MVKAPERIRPIDVPQEVIDMLCQSLGIQPDQAADFCVFYLDELIENTAPKTRTRP
jgi:hypothetical protein